MRPSQTLRRSFQPFGRSMGTRNRLAAATLVVALLMGSAVAVEAGGDGTPAAEERQGDASRGESATLVKRVWHFVGAFHPMFVHFPIALLSLAVGAEFLRSAFPRVPFGVVLACLTLGALSAAMAAAMGWANAQINYPNSTDTTLFYHRWLGVAVGGLSLVLIPLAMGVHRFRRSALRRLYLGCMVVLAIGTGVVGHFGGSLVYGSDYYVKAFERLEPEATASGGKAGDGGEKKKESGSGSSTKNTATAILGGALGGQKGPVDRARGRIEELMGNERFVEARARWGKLRAKLKKQGKLAEKKEPLRKLWQRIQTAWAAADAKRLMELGYDTAATKVLAKEAAANEIPKKSAWVSYSEQIKPVFEEAGCIECHGRRKAKGDLRLHTRGEALAGTGDAPLFIPGDPSRESLLISVVTDPSEDERMPPPDEHERLKKGTIDTLKRWVAQGAPYSN